MGRDRFVKIEWGAARASYNSDFGYCDHGQRLASREEAEVYNELKAQGYTVTKHGWPDFMARRGDEVRLIEVKSEADHRHQTQKDVSAGLARLGAKVELIIKEAGPGRRVTVYGRPTPLPRQTAVGRVVKSGSGG